MIPSYLVDADLEGRLRKGDWEMWEAAINELRVAKRMEEIFGIKCLNWRPQGRERTVGEFEILSRSFNMPIFVEVKTILRRDLENLENPRMQKLEKVVDKSLSKGASKDVLRNVLRHRGIDEKTITLTQRIIFL